MHFSVSIPPMVYIYGLIHTSANELVYVGQTRYPKQRFAAHCSSTVKDIKKDCHMIILEEGHGMLAQKEYQWIEYFRFIGCNLRNNRVRADVGDAIIDWRFGDHCCVMPHLIADMDQRKISSESIQKYAGISFSLLTRLRHGDTAPWNVAYRVGRVLHLGTDIFEGLTARRAKNLIYGSKDHESRIRLEQSKLNKLA